MKETTHFCKIKYFWGKFYQIFEVLYLTCSILQNVPPSPTQPQKQPFKILISISFQFKCLICYELLIFPFNFFFERFYNILQLCKKAPGTHCFSAASAASCCPATGLSLPPSSPFPRFHPTIIFFISASLLIMVVTILMLFWVDWRIGRFLDEGMPKFFQVAVIRLM